MSHNRTSGINFISTADCKVTVTNREIWEKQKKGTIYKIYVQQGSKHVQFSGRYNDILSFYDKIKKQYHSLNLKLPGKKIFGSLDPKTVHERSEALRDFFTKLISHDECCSNPDVRQFMHLEEAVDRSQESDDDDPETGDTPEDNNNTKFDLGPSEKVHVRPKDFEFLKVIGKGSFGKVLLAKHKEEKKMYAVKVLNKSHIVKKNEAKHIMSERNVLVKNVEHPFLVGLHYSFQTPDKLYFVLDYVNGGEMFFHLQKERCFPEPRVKFYAAEMASALGYLHGLNIIYRDLKPENILLDSQGHITLTDFGLCKEGIEGRGTTSTFCGTPEYLAPEVLRKQPYDKTVDWWCLGAVTYEMMYGLPPFYSRDVSEMYDNILYKQLKFRNNVGSPQARGALEGLLQKDRTKRLGAEHDFQDVKQHPFFSSINWTLLDKRSVRPPYNPNVSGPTDLKHFDPEFVREPVPASVGKSISDRMASASVADNNAAFEGFSYVPPSEENFHL